MKLYTEDGCSYDGMDADTVTRLRTELGKDTQFVDQQTYEDYIASYRSIRE